jgi:sulfatase modifying factor 1
MKTRVAFLALTVSLVAPAASADAADDGMARVGPGTYRPFYPPAAEKASAPMPAFLLDRLPVTRGEYEAFVRAHPRWQRGNVSRLFADAGYLASWKSPTDAGAAIDRKTPVVEISWFAAKAYCAARDARLPTEKEWEFAATAGVKTADARAEPEMRKRIVEFYSRPTGTLPRVGTTAPNFWGVRDLHGVVWEWVLDFNSTLVSSDAREAGDQNKMRFCGAGALTADDKTDYPSFMRIAFRSSLRGDFTTKNLGFRCARSLKADDASVDSKGTRP